MLILAAHFGAEATYGDLTTQLQHVVHGSGVQPHVNDSVVGDPSPGKGKALLVVYRTGNRTRLSMGADSNGRHWGGPADAVIRRHAVPHPASTKGTAGLPKE